MGIKLESFKILLPLTIAIGGVGCGGGGGGGSGSTGGASSFSLEVPCEAKRYFELQNIYRSQLGLERLYFSSELYPPALWHAEDMAVNEYLSHTDSLGRDPSERIADFGYAYPNSIGENAAVLSDGSAEAVFCGWKNSPGHHANMIRDRFVAISVGLDLSERGLSFWSTAFATQPMDGDPVQVVSATPGCPAALTLPDCSQ